MKRGARPWMILAHIAVIVVAGALLFALWPDAHARDREAPDCR